MGEEAKFRDLEAGMPAELEEWSKGLRELKLWAPEA